MISSLERLASNAIEELLIGEWKCLIAHMQVFEMSDGTM